LFYSSQADYNCYQVIVNFVSNFDAMAIGIGPWKMQYVTPYKFAISEKHILKPKNTSLSYTEPKL